MANGCSCPVKVPVPRARNVAWLPGKAALRPQPEGLVLLSVPLRGNLGLRPEGCFASIVHHNILAIEALAEPLQEPGYRCRVSVFRNAIEPDT